MHIIFIEIYVNKKYSLRQIFFHTFILTHVCSKYSEMRLYFLFPKEVLFVSDAIPNSE